MTSQQSHDNAIASAICSSAHSATEYGSVTIGGDQRGPPPVSVSAPAPVSVNSRAAVETIEIRTERLCTVSGYQRFDNEDDDNEENNSTEAPTATNHYIGSFGCLDIIAVQRLTTRAMEIMESDEQRPKTLLNRIELGLNALAHLYIAFTTLYMSWFCLSRGLVGTGLHAWLVTIGFICLMAEGVMAHYNANILTSAYKRNQKTRIHWMLQAIGGSLGSIGALIKCIQKGFLLHTVHGKLGFIALVLCILTMLSGMSALYAVRVKQLWSPLQNKTFHNCMGLTTFIIAMAAQYYGYRTGYFGRQVPHVFRSFMEGATLIGLGLCCVGPVKALINKMQNLIRQI